jgi:hypothetical protein
MTADALNGPTLGRLVQALGEAIDDADGAGPDLVVTSATLELPCELRLRTTPGGLLLGAAPPTQIVQTSVMPVLHRLRLTLRLDDGHHQR